MGAFRDAIERRVGKNPREIFENLGFAVPNDLILPGEAGDVLSNLAVDLIRQTEPLRDSLIDRSQDFLSGGFDPTKTPAFGARKLAAETQGQNARDAILANLPAGGALMDKLADVEIAKAGSLTGAASDIFDNEMNRAFSLATGAPLQTGLGTLNSQAIADQQMRQAQMQSEAARDAAQKESMGAGLGSFAGMAVGDK